jgi:crotonobetainyl-CoA:carnitine CoA-transferase CaiB-like acyl-CoA transferase
LSPETAYPLEGIRVVALEQALAAPFCSRQLADLGADVVKIERPGEGDMARGYDEALHGVSTYFAWLNRGKRSITLDLKQPADLAVAAALIDRADVLVHNLAPGAIERLGFGYEELSRRLPRLVWCGISGYGPNGPATNRKAYDLLVQAEAGVIELTGTPEVPSKPGVSIADIAAGMYGYSSVMAALFNRERTGRGERIDISMFECLTEWIMPPIYFWHGTGTVPTRPGVRHNQVVPYGGYPCADGLVMLAVQNDREWRRFCSGVLNRPELAEDPRFTSNALRLANRRELEDMIEARFRPHTREVVLGWLEQADIPTSNSHTIPEVAAHPQLAARNRWVTVGVPGGTIPALLPPHNLRGVPPRMGPIPAAGEHTDEILAELGMARGD